jgi:curved DNA-binding protein CbpA
VIIVDAKKDYYATLGVLPDADSVVIRAVFKALAQRYHPDKFQGVTEEADKKMSAINEAYEVLSDALKRKEYDSLSGSQTPNGESYFGEDSNDLPPSYDPLDPEWKIATKYYPDLPEIEERLSKIAWRLAYTFKAFMLQEKEFEQRGEIADLMERHFLELYFGSNPVILSFAKKIIFAGKKSAAKELNETIRVLGNKSDPNKIVERILKDHNLSSLFVLDQFVEMARNWKNERYDLAGIRRQLSIQGLTESSIDEVLREIYR